MVNHLFLKPRYSSKCDFCKKGKPYRYLGGDDYTKATFTAKAICKKCFEDNNINLPEYENS